MARTRCIAARFRKTRALVTVFPRHLSPSFYDNVYVTCFGYRPRHATVWSPGYDSRRKFSHKSSNFVKRRRTDARRRVGDDFLGIMVIVSSPPLSSPETHVLRGRITRRVDATLGHAEFSSPMLSVFARDSAKRIDRLIESISGTR